MAERSKKTDLFDGTGPAHPRRARQPGFAQLKDYPELIPLLDQAVDEVLEAHDINREREPDLAGDVERAAATAALATYRRTVGSATSAGAAVNEARQDRARSVAAAAEVIAGRVAVAAAETHLLEEARAERLAEVAAKAASELAAQVGFDDETAAAVAAALVIRAVGEAAAVNASARARAVLQVAQAAADAAASVAEGAAAAALAADVDLITKALHSHLHALEACYEAAAAAAHAVLARRSGAGPWSGHPG